MQRHTTYDEAISRKYPDQVAIAIAKNAQGRFNPITLGWVMCTSGRPPMLAISVGRRRQSLEAIRTAKQFVLAFPTSAQAAEAAFYGSRSGRDIDKFAEFKTRTQPAEKIDSVLLSEAAANFECMLESELETGDHVIFVGRVVSASVNEAADVARLYTLSGGALGGVREDKQ